MKRTVLLVAALAATACKPAEIVVTAQLSETAVTGEAQTLPLGALELQLLPYDRDVVFDSLSAAAATPEPAIPADLLEQQSQVAAAQQEWRNTEARWNTLRDTLQKINQALQGYSRGEARYVALFREFNDLDGELNRVEGRMRAAFSRFDSLQKAGIQRTMEVRMQRDAWGDEVFADVDAAIAAKLAASGGTVSVDTTEATGVARFEVSPGQYWIYARYELPYTELYWNVPVTAERGDPVQVQLDRSNAESRPKL